MMRTPSANDQTSAAQSARHTLVVGLGATGLAVARHLARRGEFVRVVDSRSVPPGFAALRSEFPQVDIAVESLGIDCLSGTDQVALSPGLDPDLPLIREARDRGIEIVGEIELFAREVDAPVVAVTGSNGKSTVTTLVGHLLAALGHDAPVGGNLGPPALELLDARGGGKVGGGARGHGATASPDVYVLEISSFQMETTESLRPRAATVLNLSADHLDRHKTIERYAALKAGLLRAAEIAVFNLDDPMVETMATGCERTFPFSVTRPLEHGWSIVLRHGRRYLGFDGRPVLAADELGLCGLHNEANALAALALVANFDPDVRDELSQAGAALEQSLSSHSGAPLNGPDSVSNPRKARICLAALAAFEGLPHRCQPVGERAHVTYVDDSKGTNVGATMAAIEGFAGPLVLIAGGLGKGADFSRLAQCASGKLRAVVLIGEAAGELEQAFSGVCATSRAKDLSAAVDRAAAIAVAGDTVLLSPACASQDQFRDYRHRGEVFSEAVRGLRK